MSTDGLFDDDGTVSAEALPALPYAGTSGWSGSETSEARQQAQDADGKTTERQRRILTWLAERRDIGATWKDVAERYDWHHGQASGALSTLHKAGLIARLKGVHRQRCAVYVLPAWVGDRATALHGRQESETGLRFLLSEVRVSDGWPMIGEDLQRAINQALDGAAP